MPLIWDKCIVKKIYYVGKIEKYLHEATYFMGSVASRSDKNYVKQTSSVDIYQMKEF